MKLLLRLNRCCLLAVWACLWAVQPAQALTADEANAIAAGENDTRINALNAAMAKGDESLAVLVQALLDDAVKVSGDRTFIVREAQILDAATGAPAQLPDGAQDV